MQAIHARRTVSVSDFKKNPPATLREAQGEPVAVLNHGRPAFYAVPPEEYEQLVQWRGVRREPVAA